MPKIYIANTTVRPMEFNYRTPTEPDPKTGRMMWSERVYVETIPAGRQIVLGGGREFTELEVKHLFDHQASTYGARRGNEELPKGFVGVILDTKPINLERLQEAIKHNQDAADERSESMLSATAAALLTKQSEKAQEMGMPIPDRAEIEVAAEKSKDIDVGGRGAEAVQPGVQPSNRDRRRGIAANR